jgi:hypothetical protein
MGEEIKLRGRLLTPGRAYGVVALLLVVLASWWTYDRLQGASLEVDNRLGVEVQVGSIGEMFCEELEGVPPGRRTWKGDFLFCTWILNVRFHTPAYVASCTWDSAKAAEPVVIDVDGVSCLGEIEYRIEYRPPLPPTKPGELNHP